MVQGQASRRPPRAWRRPAPCTRNQVRRGLRAGGKWIRTIGPSPEIVVDPGGSRKDDRAKYGCLSARPRVRCLCPPGKTQGLIAGTWHRPLFLTGTDGSNPVPSSRESATKPDLDLREIRCPRDANRSRARASARNLADHRLLAEFVADDTVQRHRRPRARATPMVRSRSSASIAPSTVDCSQRAIAILSEYIRQRASVSSLFSPERQTPQKLTHRRSKSDSNPRPPGRGDGFRDPPTSALTFHFCQKGDSLTTIPRVTRALVSWGGSIR